MTPPTSWGVGGGTCCSSADGKCEQHTSSVLEQADNGVDGPVELVLRLKVVQPCIEEQARLGLHQPHTGHLLVAGQLVAVARRARLLTGEIQFSAGGVLVVDE